MCCQGARRSTKTLMHPSLQHWKPRLAGALVTCIGLVDEPQILPAKGNCSRGELPMFCNSPCIRQRRPRNERRQCSETERFNRTARLHRWDGYGDTRPKKHALAESTPMVVDDGMMLVPMWLRGLQIVSPHDDDKPRTTQTECQWGLPTVIEGCWCGRAPWAPNTLRGVAKDGRRGEVSVAHVPGPPGFVRFIW